MKRLIKYIIVLLVSMYLFSSCEDINEPILFNDGDKFVSFESTNGSLAENSTEVHKIPVYLASTEMEDLSLQVEVVTDDINNPAIEGTDFTIASKEITFNNLWDTLEIQTIDNDFRDKDKTVMTV